MPYKSKPLGFSIWSNMRQRCCNPSNHAFAYYGGRGIRCCDRWAHFRNFIKDMGPPPDGLTLERIDNERGYEPSNCKWATRLEQLNNTRKNRYLTFDGRTLSVSQWARELGVLKGLLTKRLKLGWSVDKVLTAVKISREERKHLQCKRGHLMTEENIYYKPAGGRECLTCRQLRRSHKVNEPDSTSL